MTTRIESSTYENGRRVEIVRHEYTLPDEYNMLARLYSGLANLTTEGKDTAEVTALIEQQLEYIKGYE
jgi:hypothetical protein